MGALDGLTVHRRRRRCSPGPMAAMHLGDMGADVIKVEHPTRPDPARGHGPSKDGANLWWKTLGRNKRTITLDLSHRRRARGAAAAAPRPPTSLIENFRPGHAGALGPRATTSCSARNPRLVLARVTGFGQKGPYRSRPGFGTLAEAMSGFAAMTGEPDGPPVLPPFGLADGIASLATAYAIMVALHARDRSGRRSGRSTWRSSSRSWRCSAPRSPAGTSSAPCSRAPATARSNNAPRNTYRTADGSLGRGVDERAVASPSGS